MTPFVLAYLHERSGGRTLEVNRRLAADNAAQAAAVRRRVQPRRRLSSRSAPRPARASGRRRGTAPRSGPRAPGRRGRQSLRRRSARSGSGSRGTRRVRCLTSRATSFLNACGVAESRLVEALAAREAVGARVRGSSTRGSRRSCTPSSSPTSMSSKSGSTSMGTSRPARASSAVSCVRPKRVWRQRSIGHVARARGRAARASALPSSVMCTGIAPGRR